MFWVVVVPEMLLSLVLVVVFAFFVGCCAGDIVLGFGGRCSEENNVSPRQAWHTSRNIFFKTYKNCNNMCCVGVVVFGD